ncbi:MAG: RNA polymerase sigma factor [Phycisphaerales bacterium JB050]
MSSQSDGQSESRGPGAREAIGELVDRYAGSVYGLGLRFCGNATDAEDLVQEVFLNAQKGWDGFRGESDPKTWLYTIAARACQRMHRKKSGEPQRVASLDADLPFGDRLIAMIPSEQEDGVQEQIRREARERVEAAIAALPEDFRVPLVLKEIVGFSVPEVARMLGLQEGTVKSRVHRARLKLREAVDAVLPRHPEPAPPPAYEQRVCLDLLNAKQDALDRGVEFDGGVICDRCRSVFASLDLTQQVCHDLAGGELPEGVRERLEMALRA